MKKLHGKTAIVTGSDSGIGQGIAIAYAKEGANVVVCYHTDKEGAEKTARAIENAGQKSLLLQIDVRHEEEVNEAFAMAVQEFGTIDIMVNNAGIKGAQKSALDMSIEDFDNTIKSNLYSAFFFCRSFGNHRKELGGRGKIINVSSVHEEIMAKDTSDYNAAKGALRNFTRTLALELAAHRINVNNIGPGMIVTPMNQDILEDDKERAEKEKKIPWKRAGYPQDIAYLAVFLASEEADYVTGSTYFMDGGLMLQMGAEV